MHPVGLHWFRTKQRTFTRFALAVFCLTWLQLAAMPCVMASGASMAASNAVAPAAMPQGMVMAPGEHCVYCPPEQQSAGGASVGQDLCAFPHDPQVDSRAAVASAMLAPLPAVVFFLAVEATVPYTEPVDAPALPPWPGTSFAVSFCRFLK